MSDNQEMIYVPGLLKCVKCNCVLHHRILYVKSGETGPNTKPEICPNECGPMWRVTWKDRAVELMKTCEELFERNKLLETKQAKGDE